jgi:hypothetical protein
VSDERGFSEHLPEARTLWTRYRPRGWRGAAGVWFDLIGGGLGGPTRGAPPAAAEVAPLDDVLYLPPAGPGENVARAELAGAAVERGLRPVVQIEVEDAAEGVPGPCTLLIDSLPALLSPGPGEGIRRAPPRHGVETVWLLPAIPGLTLGAPAEERVCRRVLELGAHAVHVYEPRLEGAELRRLAESAGAVDLPALFHSEPADGTPLMRAARRAGIEVLHPRPIAGVTGRAAEHRVLSGALGQAADLWLRAGRSPLAAQVLFQAARETDRIAFDLRALAREGNLKVLDWLVEPARSAVESWLATGAMPLLDELVAEVLPRGRGSEVLPTR